jgi:TRAP-type C4-dicarboxylate transport system permease small subunit
MPSRNRFGTVVSVLNASGSAWTVVLMVLICVDVVARAALNHPIRGVSEIVGLSLVACVFLQLPHIPSLRGTPPGGTRCRHFIT